MNATSLKLNFEIHEAYCFNSPSFGMHHYIARCMYSSLAELNYLLNMTTQLQKHHCTLACLPRIGNFVSFVVVMVVAAATCVFFIHFFSVLVFFL